MRDLAAFLGTLEPAPSLARLRGRHDQALIQRGQEVFQQQGVASATRRQPTPRAKHGTWACATKRVTITLTRPRCVASAREAPISTTIEPQRWKRFSAAISTK